MKKSKYIFLLLVFVSQIYGCKSNSNEVFDAFNKLNEKLEKVNSNVNKSVDSETFSSKNRKLFMLDSVSILLINYIEDIKTNTLKTPNPDDYQVMNSSKILDSYFFDENKLTNKGIKFKNQFAKYLEFISKEFSDDFPKKVNKARTLFLMNNIRNEDWLVYHFKGFPQIASITKLSQMQNDIILIKKEIMLDYLETK